MKVNYIYELMPLNLCLLPIVEWKNALNNLNLMIIKSTSPFTLR